MAAEKKKRLTLTEERQRSYGFGYAQGVKHGRQRLLSQLQDLLGITELTERVRTCECNHDDLQSDVNDLDRQLNA